MRLRSTWRPFDSSFEWKGAFSDGGNLCPQWGVILKLSVGDTGLLAATQLALSCCELYFALCCAVNWTGTFASESKVMCLSD